MISSYLSMQRNFNNELKNLVIYHQSTIAVTTASLIPKKTPNKLAMNDNQLSINVEEYVSPPHLNKKHKTLETTQTLTIDESGVQDVTDTPNQSNIEVDEKLPPDHHARRPMNAFLIFCKRHRAIVREKYPNLENRSITKILGDWWANLEKEEKNCYTNLAKQYKDAFFNANPNFKWYKLPAPPLRTIMPSTRGDLSDYSNYEYDDYEVREEFTSSKVKNMGKLKNSVGVFKLADEAQMGGLNSLMMQSNNNNNVGEDEIQEESNFSDTIIVDTTDSTIAEPFSNMKDHAAKMEMISLNHKISSEKRKSGTELSQISKTGGNGHAENTFNISTVVKKPRNHDFEILNSVELGLKTHYNENKSNYFTPLIMTSKKSSRACKGKRYQEFMTTGKINQIKQRTRTKLAPTSTITTINATANNTVVVPSKMNPIGFPHNGYCKSYDYTSPNTIENDLNEIFNFSNINGNNEQNNANTSGQGTVQSDANGNKLFDASDFDLEDKIKALPSLSLDKYLTRKRETKKKKKLTNKTKRAPQTIFEARDKIKNSMVGSQKRKARKESITRRDVNNETVILPTSTAVPPPATSDLFILATLAEEEAKRTSNFCDDGKNYQPPPPTPNSIGLTENKLMNLEVGFLS